MRIGLSQAEFAALGGLQPRAQLNYESGARSPDANYLGALKDIGVDVLYVLTGERTAAVLSDDENEVVGGYRQLGQTGRTAVQHLIRTFLANSPANAANESGVPAERRVKRLAENRMVGLDDHAADVVRRAKVVVEQFKAERAGCKAKGPTGQGGDSE
ncbi:XRE family transcriptional regulator [Burkholderia sp. Nafp2/4-1b]|uniref:helix-turn-helix domain-containing protein n=1 Tax=Burkholderia sp. Nafp2/4-1b TaxID=2116686 RepID=UPI000EF872FB|nr:XRE family transcriptional regulator [Burkholderia sp. Nafp2/4-1b]RKU01809.1 XRE family transcriptional regulator [Burkholderia sp. Nafp2/4-1b]